MKKRSAPRDGGLRKVFKDHLRDLMWVPIETWAVTGAGVPDSWYLAVGGISGWVEFKKHPRRVTPEQAAFLSRVARMGGRSYVAILVPGHNKYQNELKLYCGTDALALARGGHEAAAPLLRYLGTPATWDWTTVRQILAMD